MPHQCIRCEKFYEDGAAELLKGCVCGSKFFFFFRKKPVEEAVIQLSDEEKQQVEQDIHELVPDFDEEKPVILDIESIRVQKPGQYEIGLVKLFKGEPLVYKLEDGKYIIDIAASFKIKKEDKD